MKSVLGAAALAFALVLAGCATPSPVRVIQPVSAEARGQVNFDRIEVVIGETARENVAKLDAEAARKRAEAKLAPVSGPLATRPTQAEFETLPLTELLAAAIRDSIGDRSVPGGRPLMLTVQVDNIRTANAAAAWLAGSNDQLAGLVTVSDPATGQKLGSFYVDVLEMHSGLLAMAMRGSGVREKMATTFAGFVRQNL